MVKIKPPRVERYFYLKSIEVSSIQNIFMQFFQSKGDFLLYIRLKSHYVLLFFVIIDKIYYKGKLIE